jgi:transcriptional regulator with XRE-family HTH domain
VGLSPQRLSYLERGEQRFRIDEVAALAQAFGLSVEELVRGGRRPSRATLDVAGRLAAVVPADELNGLLRILDRLLVGYAVQSPVPSAETHGASPGT